MDPEAKKEADDEKIKHLLEIVFQLPDHEEILAAQEALDSSDVMDLFLEQYMAEKFGSRHLDRVFTREEVIELLRAIVDYVASVNRSVEDLNSE
jgi:hypothetical protein